MHYARPLSALLLGLLLASHSLASERYEHFKGQPSENLPQALHNLAEYNQKLQALLAKPAFDEHDLHEVHALTYTLENALGRIDSELKVIAADLEAVHKASEHNDPAKVRQHGQAYLQGSQPLQR